MNFAGISKEIVDLYQETESFPKSVHDFGMIDIRMIFKKVFNQNQFCLSKHSSFFSKY